MNCPKCGAQIADGLAVCDHCGSFLTPTVTQSKTRVYTYANPTHLVRLVWLTAGSFAIVLLLASLLEWRVLAFTRHLRAGTMPHTELVAEAQTIDRECQQMVHWLLVTALATSAATLFWVYRANRNIHALGAHDLRFSPAKAVGCFFIPFVNIIQPHAALEEIYKASVNPRDWVSVPGYSLLGWWWGLAWVSGIVAHVSNMVSSGTKSADGLAAASIVALIAYLPATAEAVITIVVVTKISKMQKVAFARGVSYVFPEPLSASR